MVKDSDQILKQDMHIMLIYIPAKYFAQWTWKKIILTAATAQAIAVLILIISVELLNHLVSEYYRDRRVERQSRWPEALFRRLPPEIRSIRKHPEPISEMPSGLFIYFECLSTLLSL